MTKSLKIFLYMVLLIEASLYCDAQSFYNQSNMLVGKIEYSGIVRDKSNMLVGKMESDGTIRDRNNMMVGKVKTDGTVVDCNNMTVGYAKEVPVAYSAVFFFFNMFER